MTPPDPFRTGDIAVVDQVAALARTLQITRPPSSRPGTTRPRPKRARRFYFLTRGRLSRVTERPQKFSDFLRACLKSRGQQIADSDDRFLN
jgi:hypothetical protein